MPTAYDQSLSEESDNYSDDEESDRESEVSEDGEAISTPGADGQHQEIQAWRGKTLLLKVEDVLNILRNRYADETDELSLRSDIDIKSEIPDYKLQELLNPTIDMHSENTPTSLHAMAMYCKTSESSPIDRRIRKGFIYYLLEKASEAASQLASKPMPVLIRAMHLNHRPNDDEEFLRYVGEYAQDEVAKLLEGKTVEGQNSLSHARTNRRDRVARLLDERDTDDRNPLHMVFMPRPGISPGFDSKATLRRANLLVPLANAGAITAKDRFGNTPLHFALHYEQVKLGSSPYRSIVRLMIRKGMEGDERGMADAFNYTKHQESPVLYYERTRTEYEERKAKRAIERAAKRNASSRPPVTVGLIELAGKQVMSSAEKPQRHKFMSSDAPHTSTTAQKLPLGVAEKEPKNTKGKIQKAVRITKQSPEAPTGRSTAAPPATESKSAIADRSRRYSARGPTRNSTLMPPTGPATVSDVSGSDNVPTTSKTEPTTFKPLIAEQANHESSSSRAKGEGSKFDGASNNSKTPNKLVEFLKHEYLRKLSELEARDLIFGKAEASDVNLSFDGTGLSTTKAIKQLIQLMEAGGGFSSTLAVVRLPAVARNESADPSARPPEKGLGSQRHRPNSSAFRVRQAETKEENPRLGRRELVGVFQELANAGVRAIIRLEVHDLEPESHTDEAIEDALKGKESDCSGRFSIEVWNWKKPDLCIDIIISVAPRVEKVHLYWSGNRSVLRGWSCDSGLPLLYSEVGKKKLRKVTIHAAPGIERRERMDDYLNKFRKEVEEATDRNVVVQIEHEMLGLRRVQAGITDGTEAGGSGLPGDRQHAWIEHIERFRQELVQVHQLFKELELPEPRRVKVALIDDGLDLGIFPTHKKVRLSIQGLSCVPMKGQDGTPWYRSTNGHGTAMANMILRVNPWTSLYVMKFCDGIAGDGNGTTIYAKSAAKAVRAAVARKVDIISMSWTVKKKIVQASAAASGADGGVSDYDDGLSELEDAINEAARQHILMFCSASDQVDANPKDSLPYGAATSHIWRIGAADSLGKSDPQVESKKEISYYFPGKDVALSYDPRNQSAADFLNVKLLDGSSVATALAAGLASLIKYCTIMVSTFYEDRTQQGPGSGKPVSAHRDAAVKQADREVLADVLREVKNMMKIGGNEKYQEFKAFDDMLSLKENMEEAFDSIKSGTFTAEPKFLPVWDTFGKFTDGMRDADHLTKMKKLEGLTSHLCKMLSLKLSSYNHRPHGTGQA